MTRKHILIISLSQIVSDSRVLRQIKAARRHGHVTTIGYGPQPPFSDEHIEVPSHLLSLPQTPLGVALLSLRLHRLAKCQAPGVKFILRALKERRFDLVIANEARVLACASRVAQDAPVWVDLHEYAPEERTHILVWKLLVAPLMTYMCRRYLPKVQAATSVSPAICHLYEKNFGISVELYRSTPAYVDLEPQPVKANQLRMVHTGGAVHGRNIEAMIDAAIELGPQYPLDLYLIAAGDGGAYLSSLKERAAGHPHIRICDPLPPHQIVPTINAYDLGLFWIPPVHTNARYVLPNKFFDYVQARLALAIGPSSEMKELVEQYDCGIVSEDFTVDSIVSTLRSITAQQVMEWKKNSHLAAYELSFESESRVQHQLMERLLESAQPGGYTNTGNEAL